MNLHELVVARDRPVPWAEGDNIPWHDPEFSAAMLKEHLSQAHDMASRRAPTVDAHVAWFETLLPPTRPARILDLGCGPGLYATRFARHGHTVTGIDFSPASIEYAQATALAEQLPATFHLADIRHADYGSETDLAMLIFGEFNVFRPADGNTILAKIAQALRPGGVLVLEPHTYASLHASNLPQPSFYRSTGGLWSAEPHMCLMEYFWDDVGMTATYRYYIIPGKGEVITRYAQSMQAYSMERLRKLLQDHGFTQVRVLTGLAPERVPRHAGLCAVTAVKA